MNGSLSSWSEVISGVFQGSVLGPLFFAIFIKDLSALMRNKVLLFADDTKIGFCCDNPVSSLQDHKNTCIEWAARWQLPFNNSKCKIQRIGRSAI